MTQLFAVIMINVHQNVHIDRENRIMELKRVLLKLSGEALAGDKKNRV